MQPYIRTDKEIQPIKAKEFIAFNGFTVFIHGKVGEWRITELSTGMAFTYQSFKTIKQARQYALMIVEDMTAGRIVKIINRQNEYINQHMETWVDCRIGKIK